MSASPTPPDVSRNAKPTRAVFIGAGAVGTHIATSLRADTPQLIIDPDARVQAALAARGAAIASPLQSAEDAARLLNPGDVAIVSTSASLVLRATQHLPAWMPIVCLSNGLIPELISARPDTLAFGVVEFGASVRSPGLSTCTRAGHLLLQRESAGGVTQWLASALNPSEQPATLTDHIHDHRHSKLMMNASLDPVAAVIGGTIGSVFAQREAFLAFRVLLREALAVAKAAGWRILPVQGMKPTVLCRIMHTPLLNRIASMAAAKQAKDIASTLSRELQRGQLGEADYLCGAIAREGRAQGVATPGHDRVMAVLTRIASQPSGGGGKPEFARDLLLK